MYARLYATRGADVCGSFPAAFLSSSVSGPLPPTNHFPVEAPSSSQPCAASPLGLAGVRGREIVGGTAPLRHIISVRVSFGKMYKGG